MFRHFIFTAKYLDNRPLWTENHLFELLQIFIWKELWLTILAQSTASSQSGHISADHGKYRHMIYITGGSFKASPWFHILTEVGIVRKKYFLKTCIYNFTKKKH